MTTRDRAKPNDSISYCWIPNAVIASILVAYTFAHAVILTDGYYKTCNWYRLDLVKVNIH